MKIELYTDGSTKNNGHGITYGGWAYSVKIDSFIVKSDSGNEENTTNQRMELTAAIMALNSIENLNEVITLYSDSAYLINCAKDQWWRAWETNGWVNSKKQLVANRDLWENLLPFFKMENIKWEKVKGHAGHLDNESVDGMAQRAAERLKYAKLNSAIV